MELDLLHKLDKWYFAPNNIRFYKIKVSGVSLNTENQWEYMRHIAHDYVYKKTFKNAKNINCTAHSIAIEIQYVLCSKLVT